ncbi:MAG TPA: squalene synthase HpnC [Burkholderiaceae bacterium]|nr:squalene synthase HpnC [Burkholderiaceae bacterium]
MRAVGVGHYENFPVASLLCPPALRDPIRAIYAFARTADDIADEGVAAPPARLAELARFRGALVAAVGGSSGNADRAPALGAWPGVFAPLARALRDHALPPALLHDLLDAFEQDVRNPSYTDRAALLDYCRRSANPIGRLLLHLYGIDDAVSLREADAVCSSLQLINFWQDLSVDLPRGRSYLPLADAARHGVEPGDPRRLTDTAALRALVRDLVAWAAALMAEGAPLPLRVPGRSGWELRLVMHGGWRILEKIARMDHATIVRRPRLRVSDLPLLAWRSARYRAAWFTPERLP